MRLPGEREGRAGQQVAAAEAPVEEAAAGQAAVRRGPGAHRPGRRGHAPAAATPQHPWRPRAGNRRAGPPPLVLVRSYLYVRFPFGPVVSARTLPVYPVWCLPVCPCKTPRNHRVLWKAPPEALSGPKAGVLGGDGREGGGPAAFARHGRGSHRDPHRGPSSRPVSGSVSAGDRTDAAVQLHCIDPHGAGALTQPLGLCPCQQVAGVQHGRVSASLCRLW